MWRNLAAFDVTLEWEYSAHYDINTFGDRYRTYTKRRKWDYCEWNERDEKVFFYQLFRGRILQLRLIFINTIDLNLRDIEIIFWKSIFIHFIIKSFIFIFIHLFSFSIFAFRFLSSALKANGTIRKGRLTDHVEFPRKISGWYIISKFMTIYTHIILDIYIQWRIQDIFIE